MSRRAAAALLATAALLVGAAAADGATLRSATFRAPRLTARWTLDSGDCASVVSIARSRKVDSYGFFVWRHFTWPMGNCLAESSSTRLVARNGIYRLRGQRLRPGAYYVQIQYCHDSDFSKRGNYFCLGSNPKRVRIPRARTGHRIRGEASRLEPLESQHRDRRRDTGARTARDPADRLGRPAAR